MIFRFLGAQWLAIGFVGVVSLVVSILVARILGPDLFGVYAVALSGGAIAAILIDGGFSRLLQRERAFPTPALASFTSALPSMAYGHALFAIFILLVAAVCLFPLHAMTTVSAVFFFGAAIFNQFGLSILRGDGRLVRDATWQVGNRAFTATCVVLAIPLGASLPWHILIAQFLGAAAFGFLIARYLRIMPSLNVSPAVYRAVLPFVWLDLTTALYFRGDMLLLEFLNAPKADVGKYGVAYRLVEAIILFASPVGMILFRKFRRGSDAPAKMLREMMPALISAQVLGLAISVTLIVCGHFLIALAYGEAYAGAGSLLAVLGCSLIFILPNGVLNQAALALGLERWFAISATIAAIVNIGGNLIFIPTYGSIAAAWMTVVTEAVLGLCVGAGILRRWRRAVDREVIL